MKATLFLDIDGVLNSEVWLARRGPRPQLPADVLAWHLDPGAVRLLNGVVESALCRVVLSSDWRKKPHKPGVAATEDALRARGATFELFDATPVLTAEQRTERFGAEWLGNYTPRGFEIQSWLDAHAGHAPIAIVDDCDDMEHLQDRCVLTDADVGLTVENCARLVSLMSEEG